MSEIKPIRVQLSRAKGFRLQSHSHALNGLPCARVDRATIFGNPYVIGKPVDRRLIVKWGWNFSADGFHVECKDAVEAVAHFRHALLWDGAIHDFLRSELGRHNLACWCDLGTPCHADVLMFVANSTEAEINAVHRATDDQILAAANAAMTS